jgi:hypothetical protein
MMDGIVKIEPVEPVPRDFGGNHRRRRPHGEFYAERHVNR